MPKTDYTAQIADTDAKITAAETEAARLASALEAEKERLGEALAGGAANSAITRQRGKLGGLEADAAIERDRVQALQEKRAKIEAEAAQAAQNASWDKVQAVAAERAKLADTIETAAATLGQAYGEIIRLSDAARSLLPVANSGVSVPHEGVRLCLGHTLIRAGLGCLFENAIYISDRHQGLVDHIASDNSAALEGWGRGTSDG